MRCAVAQILALAIVANVSADDSARAEHFEKKIRPVLAAHCFQCHGAAKQKGGLRLDRRTSALTGGDTGKAIVPGHVDQGELLKAVKYDPDGYKMPPTGKLPQQTIVELEQWIRDGAYWPEEMAAATSLSSQSQKGWLESRRESHWCWRPITRPQIPDVASLKWPSSAIDRLLLSKIESSKIEPTSDADRNVVLRRLYFSLVGAPPTPEELEAFARSDDPLAFEREVDRLLASPAFGEHWARRWLDLVRYSETLGHEFDFDIPNAWRYRDYVIRAINADLPYNQFILEQVAGDLLPQHRVDVRNRVDESILATGFWWFGEAKQAPVDVRAEQADHIDNQIDVFGKAFLGLTISCARCHDHKFDAISARDYYSLYGFFKSTRYSQSSTVPTARWREEIAARSRIEQEVRRRVGDGWKAQVRELPNRISRTEADSALKSCSLIGDQKTPLEGKDVRALGAASNGFQGWRRSGPAALLGDAQIGDPMLGDDAQKPIVKLHEGASFDSSRWGRKLQGALRSPTFVIDRPFLMVRAGGEGSRFNVVIENFNVIRAPIYGGLKVGLVKGEVAWRVVDLRQWKGREAYVEFLDQTAADLGDPDRATYPGDGWFTVDEVLLSGAGQPPAATAKPTTAAGARKSDFDSSRESASEESQVDRLQRLAADAINRCRAGEAMRVADVKLINFLIDRKHLRAPQGEDGKRIADLLTERRRLDESLPPFESAPSAEDGDGRDESVFVRGNSKKLGEVAPRRFLDAIDGDKPMATGDGSGRLTLARRLVDPKNPLVARVFVNRVWRHLFGRALVESPDNFGALGEPPTHRELLDHLASEFMRDGWSLKRLVRRLVLTRTFQLSSNAPKDVRNIDPENKLFSRANVRRLEAEALRDSLLATSGRKNEKMFGPGILVHLDTFAEGRGKPPNGPIDGEGRRTIYLAVRRNFPSSLLTAFDAPIPAGPVGKRSVSNVPAQALILLNDPFVVGRAKLFAHELLGRHPKDVDARIHRMYLSAFGRAPSPTETESARAFLKSQGLVRGREQPENDVEIWADLCHAMYNAKEFLFLQ